LNGRFEADLFREKLFYGFIIGRKIGKGSSMQKDSRKKHLKSKKDSFLFGFHDEEDKALGSEDKGSYLGKGQFQELKLRQAPA
jgi:hypothetical protein